MTVLHEINDDSSFKGSWLRQYVHAVPCLCCSLIFSSLFVSAAMVENKPERPPKSPTAAPEKSSKGLKKSLTISTPHEEEQTCGDVSTDANHNGSDSDGDDADETKRKEEQEQKEEKKEEEDPRGNEEGVLQVMAFVSGYDTTFGVF